MSAAAERVPERTDGKGRLAVRLHLAAERLATSLPERLGRRLFDLLARVAFRLASGVRRIVARNLARVLGRPPGSPLVQAATREAFRSYGRYWFDTFFIKTLSRERFAARFRIEGREHLDAAAEAGRGALLALPHLGNWDVAGRWVAEHGFRITAVAEELKPPEMYELFKRHREELGMGIVPLSESRKVGQELVKLLSENVLIALVCDRDLKGNGVEVEMFGATRRMPAGPALLSLATGSPLLPCATYDTEGGWAIRVGAPLTVERTGVMRDDVARLTRALAAEFERSIAANPTQWHMFQPAWPEPGGSNG